MPAYKITNKALVDLVSIGRFTEKEWGIAQRNQYLKLLDDSFSQLARNPNLGMVCDFISKGYRKLPQGSHLIFYRVDSEDVVEIIRIIHKLMDIESIF